MTVGKRFDAMMASYSSWDNLEIPLKVELKSPAKFSLSGRMYMENGQSILVSMRLLGFEVATMYADSDSLYCVDKVHKIVVAENMKNLTQLTGIDITQLQSLMLGRAFLPGEPGRLSRKTKGLSFEESTDDGVGRHNWSFSLSASGKRHYVCRFDVDPEVNQLSRLSVILPGRDPIACEYVDWTETSLGLFPRLLSCNTKISTKQLDATLRYTPSGLKFNSDKLQHFKQPDGSYRRIGLAELIKVLSKATL
ncbi:MAG: DUF4292 domain-containing protein [Clostridiales bacterium]|nr:DUF4292 domain-containing protein [Clostridiales bacterium]